MDKDQALNEFRVRGFSQVYCLFENTCGYILTGKLINYSITLSVDLIDNFESYLLIRSANKINLDRQSIKVAYSDIRGETLEKWTQSNIRNIRKMEMKIQAKKVKAMCVRHMKRTNGILI